MREGGREGERERVREGGREARRDIKRERKQIIPPYQRSAIPSSCPASLSKRKFRAFIL